MKPQWTKPVAAIVAWCFSMGQAIPLAYAQEMLRSPAVDRSVAAEQRIQDRLLEGLSPAERAQQLPHRPQQFDWTIDLGQFFVSGTIPQPVFEALQRHLDLEANTLKLQQASVKRVDPAHVQLEAHYHAHLPSPALAGDLIGKVIIPALTPPANTEAASSAPATAVEDTRKGVIRKPSVGATEGYINEAILQAYQGLQAGTKTGSEAAEDIVQALRTMPEPEYVVNLTTARDILRSAGEARFDSVLAVVEQYVGRSDHTGLHETILEVSQAAVHPEVFRQVPHATKVLGTQTVNGRRRDVLSVIADVTRALRGGVARVSSARRQRLHQEQPTRTLGDLNAVYPDVDGNTLTRAQIRKGMLDHAFDVDSPERWHLKQPGPRVIKPGLQGTGPHDDMGMIESELDSGMASYMWDEEDARSGRRRQIWQGRVNRKEVFAGEWRDRVFHHPRKGKDYRITAPPSEWPEQFLRVPGLELEDESLLVDGVPVPAAISSFAIDLLNNYDSLIANGFGANFYIPKVETPEEALLFATLLDRLEKTIGVPRGTLTIEKLNEREGHTRNQEIINWILRFWLVGDSFGRWDYGASLQELNRNVGVYPDMYTFDMWSKPMHRGAVRNAMLNSLVDGFPIGGMAAFMKNNVKPDDPPEVVAEKERNNARVIRLMRLDKVRERLQGRYELVDGDGNIVKRKDGPRQSWVATTEPEYVRAGTEPLVEPVEQFQAFIDANLNDAERNKLESLGLLKDGQINTPRYTREQLERWLWSDEMERDLFDIPTGPLTERGLRWEIFQSSNYIFQQGNGNSAAAIEDPYSTTIPDAEIRLMTDYATDLGNWHHVWIALRHGAPLTEDGNITKKDDWITPELIRRLLQDRWADVVVYFERQMKISPGDRQSLQERWERIVQLQADQDRQGIPRMFDRRLAPVAMEILERQLMHPHWIVYNKRILLSVIEVSAERRAQILDAVFSPSREAVVAKVEAGDWDPELLRIYDYVYDIFPEDTGTPTPPTIAPAPGAPVAPTAAQGRWTEGEVSRLRGPLDGVDRITLANLKAKKFWDVVTNPDPAVYAFGLGIINGEQAVQVATMDHELQKTGKRFRLWPYGGGWNQAAKHKYPDLSLFDWGKMIETIDEVHNALRMEARVGQLEGGSLTLDDWVTPLVVDLEARGGPIQAYDQTMRTLEAGEAVMHREDQDSERKKCGHFGKKHLDPLADFIQKLDSDGLAARAAGVDMVEIVRSDALNADYITNATDPRDHPFILGRANGEEMTYAEAQARGLAGSWTAQGVTGSWVPIVEEGHYRIQPGVDMVIARFLAIAEWATNNNRKILLWFEDDDADLDRARRIAEAVHAVYPNIPLAYNLSGNFNWVRIAKDRGPAYVESLVDELVKLGYKYPFITTAGFHAMTAGMFELALNVGEHGMRGYQGIQEREEELAERGYKGMKGQRQAGTPYFDAVADVLGVQGALEGSTEVTHFQAHEPASAAGQTPPTPTTGPPAAPVAAPTASPAAPAPQVPPGAGATTGGDGQIAHISADDRGMPGLRVGQEGLRPSLLERKLTEQERRHPALGAGTSLFIERSDLPTTHLNPVDAGKAALDRRDRFATFLATYRGVPDLQTSERRERIRLALRTFGLERSSADRIVSELTAYENPDPTKRPSAPALTLERQGFTHDEAEQLGDLALSKIMAKYAPRPPSGRAGAVPAPGSVPSVFKWFVQHPGAHTLETVAKGLGLRSTTSIALDERELRLHLGPADLPLLIKTGRGRTATYALHEKLRQSPGGDVLPLIQQVLERTYLYPEPSRGNRALAQQAIALVFMEKGWISSTPADREALQHALSVTEIKTVQQAREFWMTVVAPKEYPSLRVFLQNPHWQSQRVEVHPRKFVEGYWGWPEWRQRAPTVKGRTIFWHWQSPPRLPSEFWEIDVDPVYYLWNHVPALSKVLEAQYDLKDNRLTLVLESPTALPPFGTVGVDPSAEQLGDLALSQIMAKYAPRPPGARAGGAEPVERTPPLAAAPASYAGLTREDRAQVDPQVERILKAIPSFDPDTVEAGVARVKDVAAEIYRNPTPKAAAMAKLLAFRIASELAEAVYLRLSTPTAMADSARSTVSGVQPRLIVLVVGTLMGNDLQDPPTEFVSVGDDLERAMQQLARPDRPIDAVLLAGSTDPNQGLNDDKLRDAADTISKQFPALPLVVMLQGERLSQRAKALGARLARLPAGAMIVQTPVSPTPLYDHLRTLRRHEHVAHEPLERAGMLGLPDGWRIVQEYTVTAPTTLQSVLKAMSSPHLVETLIQGVAHLLPKPGFEVLLFRPGPSRPHFPSGQDPNQHLGSGTVVVIAQVPPSYGWSAEDLLPPEVRLDPFRTPGLEGLRGGLQEELTWQVLARARMSALTLDLDFGPSSFRVVVEPPSTQPGTHVAVRYGYEDAVDSEVLTISPSRDATPEDAVHAIITTLSVPAPIRRGYTEVGRRFGIALAGGSTLAGPPINPAFASAEDELLAVANQGHRPESEFFNPSDEWVKDKMRISQRLSRESQAQVRQDWRNIQDEARRIEEATAQAKAAGTQPPAPPHRAGPDVVYELPDGTLMFSSQLGVRRRPELTQYVIRDGMLKNRDGNALSEEKQALFAELLPYMTRYMREQFANGTEIIQTDRRIGDFPVRPGDPKVSFHARQLLFGTRYLAPVYAWRKLTFDLPREEWSQEPDILEVTIPNWRHDLRLPADLLARLDEAKVTQFVLKDPKGKHLSLHLGFDYIGEHKMGPLSIGMFLVEEAGGIPLQAALAVARNRTLDGSWTNSAVATIGGSLQGKSTITIKFNFDRERAQQYGFEPDPREQVVGENDDISFVAVAPDGTVILTGTEAEFYSVPGPDEDRTLQVLYENVPLDLKTGTPDLAWNPVRNMRTITDRHRLNSKKGTEHLLADITDGRMRGDEVHIPTEGIDRYIFQIVGRRKDVLAPLRRVTLEQFVGNYGYGEAVQMGAATGEIGAEIAEMGSDPFMIGLEDRYLNRLLEVLRKIKTTGKPVEFYVLNTGSVGAGILTEEQGKIPRELTLRLQDAVLRQAVKWEHDPILGEDIAVAIVNTDGQTIEDLRQWLPSQIYEHAEYVRRVTDLKRRRYYAGLGPEDEKRSSRMLRYTKVTDELYDLTDIPAPTNERELAWLVSFFWHLDHAYNTLAEVVQHRSEGRQPSAQIQAQLDQRIAEGLSQGLPLPASGTQMLRTLGSSLALPMGGGSSPAAAVRILVIEDEAATGGRTAQAIRQSYGDRVHVEVGLPGREDTAATIEHARLSGEPFDLVVAGTGVPVEERDGIRGWVQNASPTTNLVAVQTPDDPLALLQGIEDTVPLAYFRLTENDRGLVDPLIDRALQYLTVPLTQLTPAQAQQKRDAISNILARAFSRGLSSQGEANAQLIGQGMEPAWAYTLAVQATVLRAMAGSARGGAAEPFAWSEVESLFEKAGLSPAQIPDPVKPTILQVFNTSSYQREADLLPILEGVQMRVRRIFFERVYNDSEEWIWTGEELWRDKRAETRTSDGWSLSRYWSPGKTDWGAYANQDLTPEQMAQMHAFWRTVLPEAIDRLRNQPMGTTPTPERPIRRGAGTLALTTPVSNLEGYLSEKARRAFEAEWIETLGHLLDLTPVRTQQILTWALRDNAAQVRQELVGITRLRHMMARPWMPIADTSSEAHALFKAITAEVFAEGGRAGAGGMISGASDTLRLLVVGMDIRSLLPRQSNQLVAATFVEEVAAAERLLREQPFDAVFYTNPVEPPPTPEAVRESLSGVRPIASGPVPLLAFPNTTQGEDFVRLYRATLVRPARIPPGGGAPTDAEATLERMVRPIEEEAVRKEAAPDELNEAGRAWLDMRGVKQVRALQIQDPEQARLAEQGAWVPYSKQVNSKAISPELATRHAHVDHPVRVLVHESVFEAPDARIALDRITAQLALVVTEGKGAIDYRVVRDGVDVNQIPGLLKQELRTEGFTEAQVANSRIGAVIGPAAWGEKLIQAVGSQPAGLFGEQEIRRLAFEPPTSVNDPTVTWAGSLIVAAYEGLGVSPDQFRQVVASKLDDLREEGGLFFTPTQDVAAEIADDVYEHRVQAREAEVLRGEV